MKKINFSGSVLPVLLKGTEKYSILFFAIIIGAIVGLFFLYPLHEIARYFDLKLYDQSILTYLTGRFSAIIQGQINPIIGEYWVIVGAFLGTVFYFFFRKLHSSNQVIRRLRTELEKSFPVLLSHGESSVLEFKSSLRWDVKTEKVNKNLENVILKTVAGFLNADGGTLLIGVADDGKIFGLEKDYEQLKKKDRDGFEQAVVTVITHKLGANVCNSVLIMFHSIEGKDVCRLIVMPSPKPVYVKDGNLTKFYLRTGCSTRELNLQDAVEYISSRWGK